MRFARSAHARRLIGARVSSLAVCARSGDTLNPPATVSRGQQHVLHGDDVRHRGLPRLSPGSGAGGRKGDGGDRPARPGDEPFQGGQRSLEAGSRRAQRIRLRRAEPVRGDPGIAYGFPVAPAGSSTSRSRRCSRRGRRRTRKGARLQPPRFATRSRCVGYEKIETRAPDRIRLRSDCLEIDLGGIGKGYAVDRAIGVLKAAGIRHALVNAGSSSIAAIGAHPAGTGGRCASAPECPAARSCCSGTARYRPLSRTSRTRSSPASREILDPHTGAPAGSTHGGQRRRAERDGV